MYQIGTICIGQNFIHSQDRNGMECEVIAPCQYRSKPGRDIATGVVSPPGYKIKVRWADGEESWTKKYNLRPKHEPGSWDDEEFQETLKLLGWNPKEKIND